jgi:16S rRNA (cytidine1402-2'-O)-methyltransferase
MVAPDEVRDNESSRATRQAYGSCALHSGEVAGLCPVSLVLVGTPIGNLADASPRLASELLAADVIAAEDTRKLRRLVAQLGLEVTAKLVSYFDGNEAIRIPRFVEAMRAGQRVVVVTDAGMPSVSDPGYRLVRAAIDAQVEVTAVPGPSAVLVALAISGLPVDRFCFEGFLPRKQGERTRRLESLAAEQRTMIFFEAPHRTNTTLKAMKQVWGADRQAAVARELTKTYEEVWRGSLAHLVEKTAQEVRGEVTIVVSGHIREQAPDLLALTDEVHLLEKSGISRKEAIATVAAEFGIGRRELYNRIHQGES